MHLPKIIYLITIILFCSQVQAIECPGGFDLVPPRQIFGICVVVGCQRAIKNQLCTSQCIEGFYKTASQSCEVIKCISQSKTICSACDKGFQLKAIPGNPILRVCVPTNCIKINKQTRLCEICQSGYALSQNGTCSLVNCDQANDDSSQCALCKYGFTLTNIGSGVNACISKNCLNYSTTTYKCLQCHPSFILDTNIGVCKIGLKNCANFNQFSGLCYSCQKGYKLVALRSCIKEDPNCLQYDIKGCIQCKAPTKVVNGSCLANYCQIFDPENPLSCQKCEPGFILNQNKLCQLQFCQQFNQQNWTCNKCLEFFDLIQLPSVLKPNILVQRCITKFCQIFDDNRVNCSRCDDQHTLSNGLCVLSNCQKSEKLNCTQCSQGWVQNQNGNCVLYDCQQYINPIKCKKCAFGKRLYKDNCVKDNCIFRLNDGTCGQCPISLQIHPKFQQFCVAKFCKKIDESNGDCTECISNFKLNQTGLCSSTLCTQYQKKESYIDLQCVKCLDGYEPRGAICIPSSVYCSQYKFEQDQCVNCSRGYEFINNKTLCAPIKCRRTQEKSTYFLCKQCNLGFDLLNFDNGTQICNPYNCTKFNNGKCSQCVTGFFLLIDICVAMNCNEYNNKGFCTQCQNGFFLDTARLICLREKCLQDTFKGCIKCQLGFEEDNQNQGLCRPYNCQKVVYINRKNIQDKNILNTVVCQKCDDGFTSLPNIQMCVSLDCQSQDATGLCKNCRTGFVLKDGKCNVIRNNDYCPDGKYIGPNSVCQPIKAKNCLVANPQNTNQCYKCKQDYYLLTVDKSCRSFANCLQKNFYLGCLKCEPGYNTNRNTGQCQGSVFKCQSYDNVTGQCQICESGLQLVIYPNKGCKPVPDFCLNLDPWGQCLKCKRPNSVLTNDKFCIIQTNNCSQYNQLGFCSSCSKGFYMIDESTTPSCISNPNNCEQAIKTGECIKCIDNFILQSGQCYEIVDKCINYSKGSCNRCQVGYFLDTKLTCRQLPKYCDQVVLNTDGVCGKCRPEFTNANGVCVRNIDFCVQYDSQTGKCTSCTRGYSLSSSQFVCILGSI